MLKLRGPQKKGTTDKKNTAKHTNRELGPNVAPKQGPTSQRVGCRNARTFLRMSTLVGWVELEHLFSAVNPPWNKSEYIFGHLDAFRDDCGTNLKMVHAVLLLKWIFGLLFRLQRWTHP